MLFVVFILYALYKDTSCFMWLNECGVVPAPGCTCIGSDGFLHVICSDLDLEDVPQLTYAAELELYDLSANEFTEISQNCFGNAVVKELILTDNGDVLDLDSCTLTVVQQVSITHLKLANDGLLSAPRLIQNLTNLLALDLSANRIQFLAQGLFKHLYNLRRLELKGNPLLGLSNLFKTSLRELSLTFDPKLMSRNTELGDLIHESGIEMLGVMLSKLVLEDFPIRSAKFLSRLSGLESLRMSRCSLKDEAINAKGKSLLRSLCLRIHYLDLSDNQLKTFPTRMLREAFHLRHLDVSANRIAEISYSCSGHPELRYLDLSRNRIRYPKIDIDETSKLEHLDLSNNRIDNLESQAFKHAYNLRYLDLSGNLLVSISRNTFPDEFPHGLTIYLRENPLQCDVGCRLQWLVWRVGQQAETGIGPFSWYDVHNMVCTDALGRDLWLLGMYQSGFKFFPGCNL